MRTENKIIKLLIEDKKAFTIRQISKKIKSDYRITHEVVQKLIKRSIILKQTVGRSSLCKLNEKYYGIEIYEVEDEKKRQLLRNKDIKQFYKEILSKIDTSFFIFLVFGSYAKNKQTKTSDIDIMFISNNKRFEEKINKILSLIPVKTHILIFNEKEFRNMHKSEKSNVVKEAVNNCIILYGIENYYRLIK